MRRDDDVHRVGTLTWKTEGLQLRIDLELAQPWSHRSGRHVPLDRMYDATLSYDGRPPAILTGAAGDVTMFVSDSWHRGLPANGGSGRYFLQVPYARRDLAQRIRTTDVANQLSAEAIERADTDRARTLIGLHDPYFYDG